MHLTEAMPKAEMQVSPATFAHLLHSLQPFAGGRVLALLEGGYFLPSLAGGCQDVMVINIMALATSLLESA